MGRQIIKVSREAYMEWSSIVEAAGVVRHRGAAVTGAPQPIWDDPGIQDISPGEVECCARCMHLVRKFPEVFDRVEVLRFAHWLWRDFHQIWREEDPET